TRSSSEAVGVELRVEMGSLAHTPLARSVGTTMLVEGLFARFPARRKFLRAPTAEAAACVQSVAPLALGFPGVQFSMLVDGREALDEVDFNVHPSKLEVKLLRERGVYAAIQRGVRSALAVADWPVATFDDGAPETSLDGTESLRELRVLGQVGKTYLIA